MYGLATELVFEMATLQGKRVPPPSLIYQLVNLEATFVRQGFILAGCGNLKSPSMDHLAQVETHRISLNASPCRLMS